MSHSPFELQVRPSGAEGDVLESTSIAPDQKSGELAAVAR